MLCWSFDAYFLCASLTHVAADKDNRIQSYEEKLRSQLSYLGGKSGHVLGSLDAPFLDILDAQIGSQKQSLSVLEQIPKESEVVFEMGCQLMDEMCFKLDVPVVKLLIARF